jgi:prevent-host-death family protein
VQIAELKSSLSALLKRVERGEPLEVVHRDRPVARIVPLAAPRETVAVIPASRPFAEVRSRRYPAARWKTSSFALLMEERGER